MDTTVNVVTPEWVAAFKQHVLSGGVFDQYLKVIYDAVVERKKELDASGNLPPQAACQVP
jgi:hypothetical protein